MNRVQNGRVGTSWDRVSLVDPCVLEVSRAVDPARRLTRGGRKPVPPEAAYDQAITGVSAPLEQRRDMSTVRGPTGKAMLRAPR